MKSQASHERGVKISFIIIWYSRKKIQKNIFLIHCFLFHWGRAAFRRASTPNKRNGDIVVEQQQQQQAVVRTAPGYT